MTEKDRFSELNGVLAYVTEPTPEESADINARFIDPMIEHVMSDKLPGHAFVRTMARRKVGLPDAATIPELKARIAGLDYNEMIVREQVELKIDSLFDEIFKRDPGETTIQRRAQAYLNTPEIPHGD